MDPPDIGACHAEGALVALLVKSGITTPALITGTMRPCTGCYLTLRYARERLGVALRGAPSHNGGFWESTQTGGMLALIDAFNDKQVASFIKHDNADAKAKATLQAAFRLEGVTAFCQFVRRNFPESSNASNLLSDLTEPQPGKVPNTMARRTRTLPLEDWLKLKDEQAAKTEEKKPSRNKQQDSDDE